MKKNIDDNKEIEYLIEQNQTKDKLISILAHDLKGRIGSIDSITSYLANDYDRFSDDERRKFLMTLSSATHQMSSLLENLLSWSYSKLDKIEIEKNISIYMI